MSHPRVILVGDAHLGQASAEVERAFRQFLSSIPDPGDHVVIMGDLFDFWFEYRRVIARRHIGTLTALRAARDRGVNITFIGGNHDRWGGGCFTDDLGIPFHASGEAEIDLGGRRAFVHHGDGLTEQHWSARVMHFITRQRPTVTAFRMIHPDFGYWLADRLSLALANSTRDADVLDRAAAAQASWARDLLDQRPDIDVVALAHTHRPALEANDGRYYVNPGAFMDEGRHAIMTNDGIELRTYRP